MKARSTRRKAATKKAGSGQRTYYVEADYADSGDRLLVEDGDAIELYSVDLKLAQHWYAAAWRGRHFETGPFQAQRLNWGMAPEEAQDIKDSGLVLARCCRHGDGMPVVETYRGIPVYGSAVEMLIGEVFEAALGHLIESITGIAGLTISPMHTGYALKAGRAVGAAPIDDATRGDAAKLARVLDADIAAVAQQARRRLDFLDEFDVLIANRGTVEKVVHIAIEKNLWLLGSNYRLISSNRSLASLLKTWMNETFKGRRGNRRPDLFLAALTPESYLLVEFKRPSRSIDREDETQAIKYRDDLAHRVPAGTIEVLLVGGSRDPKVATRYKTEDLKVVSYVDLVARARDDLAWLVEQMKGAAGAT